MKRLLSVSSLGLVTVLSSQAFGSGYRMEFQSASVLADGGDAAVVEDAGTNWYNSAGLIKLPQQLVLSGIDVYAPTTFTGSVTAPSVLSFAPPPFNAAASNFTASGSASSHPNNFIPGLHYNMPFMKGFAFGLSVVPAWGFTENYGQNSILRYNLTRVYTKTNDIAPSLSVAINDQWSLGVGPDFHYFSVLSRGNVRTEGLAPLGTPGDSIQRFSANSWGYGAHIGLLYQLKESTRFGINYRTQIIMPLEGYSDFGVNQGAHYENGNFKLKVPLPPSTAISFYHDLNPIWALMGTVVYDQWSIVNHYTAQNIVQPPTPANPTGIIPSVLLPQKMHNTFDLALGTHFKYSDQITLRGSLRYEPTPTTSKFRYVNFPDGTKLGVNLGARYQYSKRIALDVIYAHVFVKTMTINDVNPLTTATASGQQRTSIDLLGGQVVFNI